MGEEIVGSRFAGSAQVVDGVGHVGRVPPDDGGDHQVQARSAVLLGVAGPLGDTPLAECANRLCQRMPLLALVEARLATPPQGGILEPVEHEQGPLDLPDLLEGGGELILPLIEGHATLVS